MGNPASPVHQPVLLRETIKSLDLAEGLTVVDGTVGAAGHSEKILEKIGKSGKLIGLDRDEMMLTFAEEKLNQDSCQLFKSSYADLDQILEECGISSVDRILLDLGLSSDQLADQERGFGFESTGPLDLRFDTSRGIPASEYLVQSDVETLEQIFSEYGEERFSRQIAGEIVSRGKQNPIQSAKELSDLIRQIVPGSSQTKKHPATRIFQALRISVNEELEQLKIFLEEEAFNALKQGGKVAIISFHSIEDRMVKNAFKDKTRWKNLTPKPIVAKPAEVKINPRARSAKLRVAAKI